MDAHGKIYLADSGGEKISARIAVFAANSDGNVPPIATIAGDKTGLAESIGLALDSSGDLYVLNDTGGDDNSGSITVYLPGRTGTSHPRRQSQTALTTRRRSSIRREVSPSIWRATFT